MDFLNDMEKKVQDFASENATTLLTAGGVVGAVGTGVLAFRAGYKSSDILREANAAKKEAFAKAERAAVVEVPKDMLTNTEKFVAVWPQFIPPAIAGTATVTAIIFSHRMSANKAAALAAAYGLSQKQFEEYKAKVEEKLNGPKKHRPDADTIDAELAQDKADRTPGAGQIIIVEGGDVLCIDQNAGRYFRSSMEKLRRIENKINAEILQCNPVSLNEFYDQLDLPPVSWGDHVGFNQDILLDLDIKAILSPEDKRTPVLAVDFKRGPVADFTKYHQ